MNNFIIYFQQGLASAKVLALTNISNHSLNKNKTPNFWKIGKIISNLKSNNLPNEPTSYRPISALCNQSNIVQRLVFNNNNPHIPLSPAQHGFRPQQSTSLLLKKPNTKHHRRPK